MIMLRRLIERANAVLEGQLGCGHNVNPEDVVRAILTAMRDPTDKMHTEWAMVGIDQDPRDYWHSGVDTILSEESK